MSSHSDYLIFHSYFSFRYGLLSLDNIVSYAVKNKVQNCILCDINYSGAIPDFIKKCKEHSLQAIAGIDFRNDKDIPLYYGIAKNKDGFEHLNRFLSHHLMTKKSFPNIAPNLPNTIFIYPYNPKKTTGLPKNQFIGYQKHQSSRIHLDKTISKQNSLYFPLITGINKLHLQLHQNLRAIDKNLLLSQINIEDNLKEFDLQEDFNNFWKEEKSSISNSIDFSKFKIEYKSNSHLNKKQYTKDAESDFQLLKTLSYQGLHQRYSRDNKTALSRINHELEIIKDLGFISYFLITWDILQYAKKNKIVHVGRGSGANSIVAFCLGITNVDPRELDLYFERFINPLRTSPPDFDIDFSWKDREKIQKYIFNKYGNEKVALIGTITHFKRRSIYRELGKIMGLPKEEIDFYVKYPEIAKKKDKTHQKIYAIGDKLKGFPNMNSVHAGGILISEKSLFQYTALHYPPKALPTTQFDMFTAEDLGFEKLDILSQRGIGHIKESISIIKENYNIEVNINEIEKIKKDSKVKEILSKGETVGAFYVESPAMQGLIKKLRCDNYLILVAASSIIRPGVAKSGMMKTYIQNYNQPNNVKYLHPKLEGLLKETYGVMVYQEDVLKVCHHFAGLNMADADILRRGMSGKYRSKEEFLVIQDKFFANCKEKQYPKETVTELWRQIESFAGYSFSKAHSASYAIESYQSLYLKAHYPLEFMVAVINNFGGFYHSWLYFHEAQRLGAKIELPNINHSTYLTRIIGKTIYIGFIHIQNIEHKWIKKILEEREENGFYTSFGNFIERAENHKESILTLIKLQVFKDFQPSPTVLLWEYFGYSPSQKPVNEELFPTEEKTFTLPNLESGPLDNAYNEIELLGFPLSLNYFKMLKTSFRGELFANEMNTFVGKTVRMLALLVTLKFVKTKTGEYMNFGFFIDSRGDYFDTTHFASSLKYYPFQGHGVYLLKGKIVEEFGHCSMEVNQMAKMPLQEKRQ